MPTEFKLPELGEGVDSADVAEVLVSEGDEIEAEQAVLEVETDKAVVEVPCPHAGKVVKVHVSVGDSITSGQTLLTIEEAGEKADEETEEGGAEEAAEDEEAEDEEAEDEEAPRKEKKKKKKAAKKKTPEKKSADKKRSKKGAAEEKEPAEEKSSAAEDEPEKRGKDVSSKDTEKSKGKPEKQPEEKQKEEKQGKARGRRPVGTHTAEPQVEKLGGDGRPAQPAAAGPATRRLAHKLDVALADVDGTGPGGRITQEDVVRRHDALKSPATAAAAAVPPLPDFSREGPLDVQPFNKIAQATVENLTRSWQLIPHVTQQGQADITELEARRREYVEHADKDAPKVTVTAIAVKAAVAVLKEFPQFNASVDVENKRLIVKKYFHVGVAVDTEHGLLVPVIRDADRKDTAEIAADIVDLAARAKERKLRREEMQGATFTISNQGGIGGTSFTPIVNWPEVAILGMSRSQMQPLVIDGQVQIRLVLPLSLSYDHRAANGADAARFITRLSELLSDSHKLMFEA